MHRTRRFQTLNWPHLLLLALLPAWLVFAGSWSHTLALGGWLLIALAVLAAGEWLQPFRADWAPDARSLKRDGTLFTLATLIDTATGALVALAGLHASAGDSTLPFALQFLLGVGAGEFLGYWLHRWSHREGWLWRVHLLHHRPTQLQLANALTAHPVNVVYDKLAHLLPMLALGLSPEAMLAVSLFVLTQALAVHANIAGHLGPLEGLVGSAGLHRMHHSTREDEAGNFGTALPCWDWLFASYRAPGGPASVGVFDPSRYPGEFDVGALLAWPLRRSRAQPQLRPGVDGVES